MKKENKLVKDLVSILVPVYNVEKYLPDLFLSIEKQKYKNIEVIFVNDGSTDNSPKLLNQFCRTHNYAYIINHKNLGLASARNTAIQYANGEYAYMVDSDDVMNIYSIKTMVDIIKQTNSDIVTSNFKFISEKSRFNDIKQKHNSHPSIKIINDNNLICTAYLSKFKSNFTRTGWNKLIKMKIVKSLAGWPCVWDPYINGGEDTYFMSKYLLKCKRAACIKDFLYFYRVRNTSITNKTFDSNYFSYMFSLKHFLKLNDVHYKKTIIYAKSLQCWFSCWLLERMRNAEYYDLTKTKWLFAQYIENYPYMKKCFKKPISLYRINKKTKKIYKELLNLCLYKNDPKRKN